MLPLFAQTVPVPMPAEPVLTTPTPAAEPVTMETVNGFWETFVNSFADAFREIIAQAPAVVAMLLVVVVGYLVARVLGRAAAALSEAIGLEAAAERSGLLGSMKQVGIRQSVSTIAGQIVFWISMCLFLSAAFNIVHWQALNEAMHTIVAYIPNLLVATIVVVVGLLVAGFLRGVVATSADRVGLSYAEHLANGCYYVLALLTFIAAFDQLGIQFDLFKDLILIACGGLALGFGLAFGLGGRDVMAGILAGYYTRQRLRAGDHVTVGTMHGRVREVGPVATIVETEEDGLLNRHSVPNVKMLNEAVR
ncbi:MAG: mechanosensitive ion channel [Pirellulales bacterium]|nr:mechanosensitive ion channel [Pirellulales bacterium]